MQACKPGSVSRNCGTSIIYLAAQLLTWSNDLPIPDNAARAA